MIKTTFKYLRTDHVLKLIKPLLTHSSYQTINKQTTLKPVIYTDIVKIIHCYLHVVNHH